MLQVIFIMIFIIDKMSVLPKIIQITLKIVFSSIFREYTIDIYLKKKN